MTDIPKSIILAAQASMKKYGIPASVSLAQWALESGWGKHTSAPHNYGGIKWIDGHGYTKGPLVRTREVNKQGKEYYIDTYFRAFSSDEEYFMEHGRLLGTAPVYAKARSKLPDPIAFANALTGVYATDPNYGKLLGQIINGSHKLRQYDV